MERKSDKPCGSTTFGRRAMNEALHPTGKLLLLWKSSSNDKMQGFSLSQRCLKNFMVKPSDPGAFPPSQLHKALRTSTSENGAIRTEAWASVNLFRPQLVKDGLLLIGMQTVSRSPVLSNL
ncbi:hypothetical protein HanRHA438_Chr17g0835751 [Helianthus annuus]|nr:hypothetical protein HanHA89_Chr17g0725391 [Helianthus annuus]KAJ0828309.1 hypothetical protein HanRHA438_Chr17g0835751 [Helianthus annuus]